MKQSCNNFLKLTKMSLLTMTWTCIWFILFLFPINFLIASVPVFLHLEFNDNTIKQNIYAPWGLGDVPRIWLILFYIETLPVLGTYIIGIIPACIAISLLQHLKSEPIRILCFSFLGIGAGVLIAFWYMNLLLDVDIRVLKLPIVIVIVVTSGVSAGIATALGFRRMLRIHREDEAFCAINSARHTVR